MQGRLSKNRSLMYIGRPIFCRVTSVLQMVLSPSLSLMHERRRVPGGSAKGIVGKSAISQLAHEVTASFWARRPFRLDCISQFTCEFPADKQCGDECSAELHFMIRRVSFQVRARVCASRRVLHFIKRASSHVREVLTIRSFFLIVFHDVKELPVDGMPDAGVRAVFS